MTDSQNYLDIKKVDEDPVKTGKTELVERKGIGHPDSIADGIAEAVSRALSKEYRERFGKILHHNTDEVQIVSGNSQPSFKATDCSDGESAKSSGSKQNRCGANCSCESCGCENSGGEIIEPIYILLTGRATKKHNGIEVPVDRIAVEAARNYIDQNFKVLSSDHIEFDARIGETSTDLKSIYDKEGAPKSNDTSFGVGHAPLSPVEKTVRTLEKVLHEKIEAAGEDIKVMGLRTEDKLKLTVATAVIDSRVTEMEEYQETVSKIKELSREHAEKHTDLETEVNVNTADIIEDESVYLTVTGTSAEMGDDGSVGRGNRSNGLITPHRAMSLEASSGKNPVSHVGKIYNLLAQQIAQDIHEKSGEYAEVKILSQIGKPIDKPEAVDVETSADRELVEKTVEKKLENIQDITDKIVYGELKTY